MQPQFKEWCRRFVRWERGSQSAQVGLLVGMAGCVLWMQVLAAFGASPAFVIGLLLAAVAGGAWSGQSAATTSTRSIDPVSMLMLAIWLVGFPWLTQLPFELLAYLKSSWLQSPALLLTCGLLTGGGLLALPHGLFVQTLLRSSRRSPGATLQILLTLGVTLIAVPTWLLPVTGTWLPALIVSALFVGLGVRSWLESRTTTDSNVNATGSTSSSAVVVSSASPSAPFAGTMLEGAALQAMLAGAAFATIMRLTAVFWLQGVYCTLAACGGAVLGFAVTHGIWGRRAKPSNSATGSSSSRQVTAALLLVATMGGAILLVPSLMKFTLQWNAEISSGAAVVGMRAVILAMLAFPLGVAIRLLHPVPPSRRSASTESTQLSAYDSSLDPVLAIATVVGYCLTVWWGGDVARTLLILVPAGLLLAFTAAWRGALRFPTGSMPRVGLLTAVVVGVCGISCRHWHDSGVASRLLFSTRTIQASRETDSMATLTALDDTRLVARRAGQLGELTFWKQNSDMLVVRSGGIPTGALSLNPAVVPQSSVELMPAIVSLTTHPNPEHLLLVGVGSSATLSASLAFPLRTLTCLEEDVDLMEMIDSPLCPSAQATFDDERVRWVNASPVLASAIRKDTYDVIIVNHAQPASLAARGLLTRECFGRWSRSLNEGGIFCQRLQFVDFGSEVVRDIVAGMSSTFKQVVVWESGPGELLLLGSQSTSPIVDEGLLTRAGALHVRRLLSQVGWDWTVPLSLLAMKGEQVQEMVSGHEASSVRESRLICGLPTEVARWGNKFQEVQGLFQGRMAPVTSWFPETEASEPISMRIADMNEQRRILDEHPDHFWAYRRTLKERLQERPRTNIVQVKHEGWERQMDPEDVRRKEYLAALAEAITQEEPDRELIRVVEEFADPYDPIVSHFLHEEVARMLAKLPQRDRTAELMHWMHAAFFGPPQDRSVGSIVESLALLCDSPESLPDPQQRWDALNGLLELMQRRWTLRVQQEKKSKYETVDAERSLRVAEQALAAMQTTAEAAGVDPNWCKTRCEVLERQLVRPLRTYQSQQGARLRAAEAAKQTTPSSITSPQTPPDVKSPTASLPESPNTVK